MELNSNFDERVAVHASRLDWVKSPMAGVERRMLDRLGGEVARATSIVRYAPDSQFSPHVHTGGEEFFVLEGVFQDEHGDFPAGSYVRNPPGSSHTPGSKPGCVIFVKLWQFDLDDRTSVTIDTNQRNFIPDPSRAGVEIMALYHDLRGGETDQGMGEDVSLERWQAGAEIALDAPGGMEVLVLQGGFAEQGEEFIPQSWLRLPPDASTRATAGADGAVVWIKRGHLALTPLPPQVSQA